VSVFNFPEKNFSFFGRPKQKKKKISLAHWNGVQWDNFLPKGRPRGRKGKILAVVFFREIFINKIPIYLLITLAEVN
jgi:hypothetical protein